MSIRQSIFLSAFASLLVLPQLAHSLDLDAGDDLADAPVIEPIGENSGFYFRADIGVTAKFESSSSFFNTYSAANGFRAGNVANQSYDINDIDVGFGVGYKINDLFRADATIDVLRGRFNQAGAGLDVCDGGPANTSCSISSSASFTNYMLMANAYVDLATVSGFTPYVGAGVGATQVSWGNVDVTQACVDGVGACGATADVNSTQSGHKSWRTTWAFMAGVSYDLSERVKFDLGYRYSHIPTGTFSTDSNGAIKKDGGFHNHQVRVGLRAKGW